MINKVENCSKNKFINYKSSSPKDMNERIIPNNLEMNVLLSRVNLEYILWIIKKAYRPEFNKYIGHHVEHHI